VAPYRALSADAVTAFGLSPALTIHDELDQVRGPRFQLYEALETATSAKEDPLSIVISTQAPNDSDLLSVLIDDAKAGHDPIASRPGRDLVYLRRCRDCAAGHVQLKLDTSTPGDYTTTITIMDGAGHTADQEFTWSVVDPPAGYGPNLVINGRGLLAWTGFPVDGTLWFEPGAVGWSNQFSVVDKPGGGKEFKVRGDGGGFPQSPVTLPAENGATYRADCISRIGTATGGPLFRVNGATSTFLGASTTSNAPYTGTMTSGGSTISFILYIASGAESGNAYWSDLAVRKVL
jgi:hypothetical protein